MKISTTKKIRYILEKENLSFQKNDISSTLENSIISDEIFKPGVLIT